MTVTVTLQLYVLSHVRTHTQCFYILKRSQRSFSVTSNVMFPTHRERQLLEKGGRREKGEENP